MASATQTADALEESGFAHAVVHGMYALAVGGLLNLFGKVLLGVENHMVSASTLGELSFFLCGNGGEHIAAQAFNHLSQEKSHSAGSGMNNDSVSLLDRVGGVAEIVGGHSLEDRTSTGFGVYATGPNHQAPGRHNCQLGIGAGSGAVGDFVAHFDFGHARAN